MTEKTKRVVPKRAKPEPDVVVTSAKTEPPPVIQPKPVVKAAVSPESSGGLSGTHHSAKDVVSRVLDNAPLDDEPLTERERLEINAARIDAAKSTPECRHERAIRIFGSSREAFAYLGIEGDPSVTGWCPECGAIRISRVHPSVEWIEVGGM